MSEDRATYGTEAMIRSESAIMVESMERAQIDMQIATAKRYPRDLHQVRQTMIAHATMDQETAEACFYSLPRGGKRIKGPGVRLAEIAVSSFGNIRVQTRVLSTDVDSLNPHVIVQATCADLQQNVAVSIEKRRRIIGKKSKMGRIDEDDITLATNACAAIAFRDSAFKVIPGTLIKPAFNEAVKVAIGSVKTLGERRLTALGRFNKMGISQERVLVAINKTHAEQIDLDDLETLFGMFTAIKEGGNIEEIFPEPVSVVPATAPTEKEQKDMAIDAAKKAGIDVSDLPEASTPADIYKAAQEAGATKKETKKEAAPEKKETKAADKEEKPKTTKDIKEKKDTQQKTLERVAKSLERNDIIETLTERLEKRTSVEVASYIKVCGMEYDKPLEDEESTDKLRKLYVMVLAEDQTKAEEEIPKEEPENEIRFS